MNKKSFIKLVLLVFKVKALFVVSSFLIALEASSQISLAQPSSEETEKIKPLSSLVSQGGGSSTRNQGTPTLEKIDFREIKPGVLGPNDYEDQGRYFDFYQFEGRKNQLIEIRVSGSDDERPTSNLSLNPVVVEMFDSNNNFIGRKGGLNLLSMPVQLASTGTYTIAISNENPGDIGRYSLVILNER